MIVEKTKELDVDLFTQVLEHQEKYDPIFDSLSYKYLIFVKGRRWGFTHFMMRKVFHWLLQGIGPILWVDTINGNIDRYFERYMYPYISQLPSYCYKWNQTKKILQIKQTEGWAICDFRSADKPENIEGFGYKKVILNEAGIILKDSYLLKNAILPMLLDYEDSQLIAGGAPKGKTWKGEDHLFYTWFNKGLEDSERRFQSYRQTTYDNVNLTDQDIRDLEDDYDDLTAQQELYAEFVEKVGILCMYCFTDAHKSDKIGYDPGEALFLSFDFNINPFVCAIWQQGKYPDGRRWIHFIDEMFIQESEMPTDKTYVEFMCKRIMTKYGDAHLRVTGDATSNKGEITQRLKRNAWTQVVTYLNISKQQLILPRSNPSVESSIEQVNAMLSKPHRCEILFHPNCKELIKDYENCKTTPEGGIDKGKDSRRSHLLDASRYALNTFHGDFLHRL